VRFDYTALPARVLFGRGRVAEIADEVRRLGAKRALVLSTPGHRALGESVAALLGDLAAGVYANATMHTPVAVTEDALAMLQRVGADCTVAVGGGSTIGLGKALALRTDLPQLVLPTTYAGSEVTTTVGETRDGVKQTQRSPRILPEVVIYDVDLTITLPPTLSATSGINAMAHAIEALYAKDANPVVSMTAEEALGALARSLPRIVADPADIDARTEAQYGAWLCGTCMGATTMGLHHKVCHVLGGAFDLPHAQTHTVMLPHVVAYNFDAAPDAMRRIARALGASDALAGLDTLWRTLPLPRSLEAIGMPASGIDATADLVMRDAYPNPRPLERAPIVDMLTRAFRGATSRDRTAPT
jgi:alcohol dehydrogenase class IV